MMPLQDFCVVPHMRATAIASNPPTITVRGRLGLRAVRAEPGQLRHGDWVPEAAASRRVLPLTGSNASPQTT